MRNTVYILIILVCGIGFIACHNGRNTDEHNLSDAPTQKEKTSSRDTLLVITMPEDALWGHLGEGTGMSVLEFITDNGDTLFIKKESEITGKAGIIYGSIRNYTDRFCITTTDEGETLVKAVNVTEMQELWTENVQLEK
jgi:hypothetical protein